LLNGNDAVTSISRQWNFGANPPAGVPQSFQVVIEKSSAPGAPATVKTSVTPSDPVGYIVYSWDGQTVMQIDAVTEPLAPGLFTGQTGFRSGTDSTGAQATLYEDVSTFPALGGLQVSTVVGTSSGYEQCVDPHGGDCGCKKSQVKQSAATDAICDTLAQSAKTITTQGTDIIPSLQAALASPPATAVELAKAVTELTLQSAATKDLITGNNDVTAIARQWNFGPNPPTGVPNSFTVTIEKAATAGSYIVKTAVDPSDPVGYIVYEWDGQTLTQTGAVTEPLAPGLFTGHTGWRATHGPTGSFVNLYEDSQTFPNLGGLQINTVITAGESYHRCGFPSGPRFV
jgi:hypothetical protein